MRVAVPVGLTLFAAACTRPDSAIRDSDEQSPSDSGASIQWVSDAAIAPVATAANANQTGIATRYDVDSQTMWIEQSVPGKKLRPRNGKPGFATNLELAVPRPTTTSRLALELWVDGRAFAFEDHLRDISSRASGDHAEVGAVEGSRLTLFTADGLAPDRVRVRHALRLRDDDGRVSLRGFSGPGFAVPSAHALTLRLPAGGAGTFRATLIAPIAAGLEPSWRVGDSAPELNADARFELAVPIGASESPRTLEFKFSAERADAYGVMLAPRLVPHELEREPLRSDVILYVADTFRADNLRAYQGLPGGTDFALTPFLDAIIAERAAWFRDAWSCASWTLPAHASMFTGYYPPEHTADSPRSRLPRELPTLAEQFSAAGFRTVAVTDGAYVSERHGLDRGFEMFIEGDTDALRTAREVRHQLDSNDGRPLFLFVQTYRVHSPYTASEVVRRALEADSAGAISVSDEAYATLHDRLDTIPGRSGARRAGPTSVVHQLRELYRAGVREFDSEFADIWRDLESRDWFERGVLAFTSDHGEAFGERERLGHGKGLGESQTRIPLFFVGAGVEPGRRTGEASIIDVGPTLSFLSGGVESALGRGRNLFGEQPNSSPVFAFDRGDARDPESTVWSGGKKWIRSGPRAELRVFELPIDPNSDVGEPAAASPFDDLLEALERPLVAAGAEAQFDSAARARLEALGYLGDERHRGERA